MTAIVGPNGCGKSNVSDAVRWVLGETRPSAIRGSSMEDCIFNGTDSHKPLGMAEVSLTLADCEKTLDLGLNEVRITRRVFRSGESDYFINKKACRRKDIHRLFMDTGVGTDSYSIMEQGKIDQILSSRPDDRRAVFEEASGITKYKTDKKEALRKLEQTEANLLRLADVIREVKRQIVSLQRQAGKARRYKDLREQLRTIDIYVTRHRLRELDTRIGTIQSDLESSRLKVNRTHEQIAEADRETETLRTGLQQLENTIASAMDESMRARNGLERARQTLQTNAERITELETLAQQNTKESEEARQRLDQHRASLDEVGEKLLAAETECERARAALSEAAGQQRSTEEQVQSAREELNRLRGQSMELDGRIGRLQNELSDIDAKERADVIHREQLAAEKKNLERTLTSYEERRNEMTAKEESLRDAAQTRQRELDELRDRRRAAGEKIEAGEQALAELRQRLADKRARLDMVADAVQEDFPAGARRLLEQQPGELIGPLAELLRADEGCETALETVLRPWMDALVVRDRAAARTLLTLPADSDAGAVRLLAADGPAPDPAENSLLNRVHCDDTIRPLAARLLARTVLVSSLNDIPLSPPAGSVYVTANGELLSAEGFAERWAPEEGEANPLGRLHLREQLETERREIEQQIDEKAGLLEALRADRDGAGGAVDTARQQLDQSRRDLAVQEGERQVIDREIDEARKRVETVAFEYQALTDTDRPGRSRRQDVAEEMARARDELSQTRQAVSNQTETLNALEEQRAEALAQSSECRVQLSQREQRVEMLQTRRQPLEARLRELEELIEERTRGVNSYQDRIRQLKRASQEADEQIEPLRAAAAEADRHLETARRERTAQTAALSEREQSLRGLQNRLEELQTAKTALEVELAEQRMRHQNTLDRLTGAWQITPEQIAREPEPEWDGGEPPPMDELETRVAELRTKLESMGPVNLVAIDEHAELEERFAFLNQQEADLIASREQLLAMIKKINETTTELFSETFNKVNENFGVIFKQLFGGGSAKLVLVDETDVLESGIEIIARPPGKKLQTISLLSGGERTMTAVALLFSLFKVKPSPFCVLDEIDAALDEANIGRFVDMLKGFMDRSQFILITHSRRTISSADVIYGVTMPNRGVSRIMSMKFSDYRDSGTTAAGG